MMNEGLVPGRYDALVDRRIQDYLETLEPSATELAQLDEVDQPHRLAAQVTDAVARRLTDLSEVDQRVALVNRILGLLEEPQAALAAPPRRLLSVVQPPQSHAVGPDIPLSQHDLLVNARGEPHLAAELKKEIASAERVDLIVAFVRWYGVRLLIAELEEAILRGVEVRLLTTTYTGTTEVSALERLREIGVDVRVSYDTQMTRLHAKAWVLHRASGYSTAYVGSSNLTHSAMVDGREWNVRLSRSATPALFDKVAAAFDGQWESSDYEAYDADRVAAATRPVDPDSPLSGLELRAWPYQDEILDALTVERDIHGSTRNLVVAPTGTGKTVVAALDYARLTRQHGDLSLLFVAHREQILRQSRRTFREALGDGSFGELLVGGHRPIDGRHVFASIQTLSSQDATATIGDRFDMVIVDEFHHAAASTYRRLLDGLENRWLLALTATPERSDSLDVRRWTDGRTAFDMRLWHALDRQLLAPFQYFGLADVEGVLTDVGWRAGQYDRSDLGRVLTGNDARDRLVVKQVRRIIGEPRRMKALGFCATVEHAHYMARVFTAAGWPSAVIDGTTPPAQREATISQLERGELVCIFSRDVLGEGVDIPEVDTILLLRPTESVTVHLQQIGRGLRRHADKSVCTILDFVGQHRREYRFDLRLRALTGIPRARLQQAAEDGFPYLPSGCHLELDRQAREWVIDHLKQAIATGKVALRRELVHQASQQPTRYAPSLPAFLQEAGVELEDLAKAGGWTALKRDVDLEPMPAGDEERRLQRGLRRLLHLDDVERIDTFSRWIAGLGPPQPSNPREERLAWMLLINLWGLKPAPAHRHAAWQALWDAEAIRQELRETLPLLRERISRPSLPLDGADVPLRLHAAYTRDELLTAFGFVTADRRPNLQAGHWHDRVTATELLFITLQKANGYSPTTQYRDYAISRKLFHWESPNSTRQDSPVGRRLLTQRSRRLRVLLAVRSARKDAWGATLPYTLLGPAEFVSASGERPIAITWRLRNAIPADLYEGFKLAAA
jgi:superfamily II DNA or RNA helicase/HKD family nuclease